MVQDKIDAVEMTRKIRDAHYEQLKDKSIQERIDFYRRKAQALHDKLEILVGSSKLDQRSE